MYLHDDWEEIIYENEHVEQVTKCIIDNFDKYFKMFIETQAGTIITETEAKEIADKVGCSVKKKKINPKESYKNIICDAIDSFNNDKKDNRDKYIELLNKENLEEEEEDPELFKRNTLAVECPVIRMTLNNRSASELDKFRKDFALASPQSLLTAVENINEFKERYLKEYDEDEYEQIHDYDALGLEDLEEDDYAVNGVIGGGIRSHMLYEYDPSVFPNRSKSALWALWFITDKKKFGCKQDSEFLMIDTKNVITQNNYFYPYHIFSYYAYILYKQLRRKAEEMELYIDTHYRYVIVDKFLAFIADCNKDVIEQLSHQINIGGYYGMY